MVDAAVTKRAPPFAGAPSVTSGAEAIGRREISDYQALRRVPGMVLCVAAANGAPLSHLA